MIRVAVYASTDVPSSHYRAYQPMLEVGRRGHAVSFNFDPMDLEGPVPDCDVAYIARYREPAAQQFARRCREAGVAVVWDHDDDVITSRRDGDAQARRHVEEIREMTRLADVVTTTNDTLAATYRDEGAAHVVAVPNLLAPTSTGVPRRAHGGIVIGWIAWTDHQQDWDRLSLAATTSQLLDELPDLHVHSVGPIDLGLAPNRYTRTGVIPFDKLPLAIAGFDIGIAPLAADILGNHARSDIKVKEYAIAGVPWLASPIGPYRELGEEHGGRLAADDDWYEQLRSLATDRRARKRLGKQGARWAGEHTLAALGDDWVWVLEDAIELSQGGALAN